MHAPENFLPQETPTTSSTQLQHNACSAREMCIILPGLHPQYLVILPGLFRQKLWGKCCSAQLKLHPSFFFFLLSSQELIGTKVYEPEVRGRLATAAHFCKAVILKLRTPSGIS